ncbi:hypothetical protein SAMN05216371_3099 [Streptomyces sp. TLI_053]|uniref:hypothetical protein n=1 Tax=Streptomyces sp. TLI_053 TaxID=1855352 RepID=UPI00087B18F7|nr:hypothetical protein [Streptomyces sp. TLI_053]SDT60426.1 hypothetical protein SAMN05216371_3099 [Streptomyces sp. TLI_053]
MIVTLVLAAEVAFWVVLALGLAARYLLRWRKVSTVLLVGLPVIDLVLFLLTFLDLRGGATASWTHALAASYLGFSVGFGPSVVRWADGWFQHRFGGGPKPLPSPKYGTARSRYEWRICLRTLVSVAITLTLITALKLFTDATGTGVFDQWYWRLGIAAVVNLVIATSYTLWPKQPPAGAVVEDGRIVERHVPEQAKQF